MVDVDFWKSKQMTDFFQYLKFEFMQYSLFGSYLFTAVLTLIDWRYWLIKKQYNEGVNQALEN